MIVRCAEDRCCRDGEWVGALQMALESEGLMTKEVCRKLALRSDNGLQTCSKRFVEYLNKTAYKASTPVIMLRMIL